MLCTHPPKEDSIVSQGGTVWIGSGFVPLYPAAECHTKLIPVSYIAPDECNAGLAALACGSLAVV